MPELGVNIDHVATLRQARRTYEPDPVWAAALAELGTSTLIMGAPGTGKSSLVAHFAAAAARRGQRSAFFIFDESLQTNEDYEFCQRIAAAGLKVFACDAASVIHLGTPQSLRLRATDAHHAEALELPHVAAVE